MKIEGVENICRIFSIFHDGEIEDYQFNNGNLQLEITIPFLAKKINPQFTKFNVTLNNIKNILYTNWPDDPKLESQKFTDTNIIFSQKLIILEGVLKNDLIQVVCNQTSSDYESSGGYLYFTAETAIVTDEANKKYSIEELDALCESYWNEWSKKNRKPGIVSKFINLFWKKSR